MARVVAVVVTYFPALAALAQAVESLRAQVDGVVIVDNTDAPELAIDTSVFGPGVTVLRQDHNHGIGQAQNRGIAHARQLGATHVLLLDQDSLPPAQLVASLLRTLHGAGPDVAAVGPVCRDVKTGQPLALIQRRGWRIRRIAPEGLTQPVSVDYIPASGTLIALAALARIGALREDYFIDRIDVEWCLRARRLGWRILVAPGAELAHDMGQRAVRLLGRTLYIGHDFRAYYHLRNSVAMALRAPIPWAWRIDQLLKTPLYLLLYTACAQGGKARMAAQLLRAVRDGVLGRMGPNRPSATRP